MTLTVRRRLATDFVVVVWGTDNPLVHLMKKTVQKQPCANEPKEQYSRFVPRLVQLPHLRLCHDPHFAPVLPG